jgi:anaphase-promoting complex subunit 8
MSLSKTETLELQCSLRQAVINCSERCQYQSAKWAAELLDALPDDDLGGELTSLAEVSNTQTDPVEMRLEQDELPKYLMAKSLLDCHEMRRCAPVFLSSDSSEHTMPLQNNVLSISHGKPSRSVFRITSQKGLFLASHALLLAGEKQKTEELGPILGPSDTGAVINKQLAPLKRMLETWFDQEVGNRRSQGWLEYLYGFPFSGT